MHPPAVKTAAQSFGIPILQPETTRDPAFVKEIELLHPDLLVVVAYGEILRTTLLQLPRLGAINLHASLLPKYRGAAPIAWAIFHGESETGITTMQISKQMDAGDTYLQSSIAIESTDTAGILSKKLAILGAPSLVQTIDQLETGTIRPAPQDHSRATMAPKLKKEDGVVNWSRTAQALSLQTRAFDPWPGSFSHLHGSLLKIWKAVPALRSVSAEPGTILHAQNTLDVACGEGSVLSISEIQTENRSRLKVPEFLNGAHIRVGERFTAV